MNLYKLENSDQDAKFLNNEVISCKIAVPEKEMIKVQNGLSIVIQLSNKKKYKGKIVSVQTKLKSGLAEGLMEIQRQ